MIYDLHTLGWKSFQDLCGTILRKVLGQTFQVFAPGNDGGRDGAFRGAWAPAGEEEFSGSFTVQAKHTSNLGNSLSVGDLKEEFKKAKYLAENGFADTYILMTNCSLTGKNEESIVKKFQEQGVKHCAIFGAEWISQIINENPSLRLEIPRLYGLGDLSQILDVRAYEQAKQLFASLQDELSKFVPTSAYRKAGKALSQFGFVCLLGEPACGKSSISRTLALFAADEWKCSTLKIDSPQEFKSHWNPHEPRQLFWVDDAFGTTQYQRSRSEHWNQYFPVLQAAITKGARVIFTSRDYIFERAKQDLKISSFPLIQESQVIIKVQELSLLEKEEILYNHIKRGDQSKSFRQKIKPFLPDVASHRKFLPEIARRLGTKIFTKDLYPNKETLVEFLRDPHDFLLNVIQTFGADEKAALALIFMKGGRLESPIQFEDKEIETIKKMGGGEGGVIKALESLKGSVVNVEIAKGKKYWNYQHPTIRDSFSSLIAGNDEMLDIYLSGTKTEKLMNEVTCGEVGIEGVKVVVPESRYSEIISRLSDLFKQPDGHLHDKAYSFLSYRCSQDFLKRALNDDFIESLNNFWSYMVASSELRLLETLKNHDMVNEEIHRQIIERIKKLAVETPDSGFLWILENRKLLSSVDVAEIMKHVQEEFISNLDYEVEKMKDYYGDNREIEPDDFFSDFNECLNDFKKYYENLDDEFKNEIIALQESLEDIEAFIYEENSERSSHEEEYEYSGRTEVASRDFGNRDRFDDIDE